MKDITYLDLPGWHFTCREISAGFYVAEGVHDDGRSVSRMGSEAEAIRKCVEDARHLPDRRKAAKEATAVSPGQPLPSIDVVGVYSLTLNADACWRFINEDIASIDPANFSDEHLALFRRLGRSEEELAPFTAERRAELAAGLHDRLADVTMFEVLVSNPGKNFDVGHFDQPDPSQSENFWQVAYNEKFLTPDGEKPIELRIDQKIPDVQQFRVVFAIHFWKPTLPLRSSYGELSLPPVEPLPERLWRLAPYETPT